MQLIRPLIEPNIRPLRGRPRLVQIYQQFCDRMATMHEAGLNVPRAKAGQQVFCLEVQKQAYDCMMKNMRPYNESVSAMLTLAIPDMIFARVDHVSAEEFLKFVKTSTLNCWDRVAEQLHNKHNQHYGLPLSTALELVDQRMRMELAQHRPLNEFFAESSDAH